ncbi:micrococcal nuclease [Sphingobacterium alimentarium]|uniref:Micrococcal nuclease n=1 Tax=Sphingobacterium alimentarium TaxID=797292 RepID=A0A4R3VSM0_9SPHI|nr:thermonuclease family protein [Sphingobacterium alimentarium]TCV12586.1 micrococcal nuclease [Sphingobacterium alimentarium]
MISRSFLVLTSFLFSYCQSQHTDQNNIRFEGNFESEMYSNPRIFKVDAYVDGDTFWMLNHKDQRVKVRLIGIDAPETKNVFRKKKHPYGAESKRYVDSILTENPYVKLDFDVDSLDQYGRTLAYVYLNNGIFLNEHLVRTGNASIMTVSPNIKYEDLFYKAQIYARQKSLGIWKDEQ